MLTVNYNVEALADKATDLFIYGIKELEKEYDVCITPKISKDRLMKRVTLSGYEEDLDSSIIEESNYRFQKSFETNGML